MTLLVGAMALLGAWTPGARGEALVGVDCNYALDMAARGRTWQDASGAAVEPLAFLAQNGCKLARIRVWVGDEGTNRLDYAIQTAQRAQATGMTPLVVIFLSEEWADMVKQPAPRAWQDLSEEGKLEQVQAYCRRVAQRFADAGVVVDTFAIGNEIDFGICGVFEDEWPKRVSLEYMSQRIWPRMTPILRAAQAGVLAVRPQARFVLHLAQWNQTPYCLAMWRAMLDAGVRVDVPGLSYFPSSARDETQRTMAYLHEQARAIQAGLGKPVLVCETGYPSAASFGGQFADWNHAAPGYALDEAGQAGWVADLVTLARRHDDLFAGVIFWSPEWYGGGLWDAFAWFDARGQARPAAAALTPLHSR
jgi:arabinogalactan endo-1,4-beta-galactosidase